MRKLKSVTSLPIIGLRTGSLSASGKSTKPSLSDLPSGLRTKACSKERSFWVRTTETNPGLMKERRLFRDKVYTTIYSQQINADERRLKEFEALSAKSQEQ